jgi:hypothetical protein
VDIGTEFPDLDTLVAVITHSQIVVETRAAASPRVVDRLPLPAGFGDVDVAVLEWIASEGRHFGRAIARL